MLLLRYITYFLVLAILMALLVQLEVSFPGALRLQEFSGPTDTLGTSEYSPLESIQALVLVICGLLLTWVARNCPSQRPVAILFSGVALAFLLRELDYFLDLYVADNFWQAMTAVVCALVIVYCYRHWRRLRIAWFRVWPSPGLTLYFAGAVVVFIGATFIGQEPLWQSVLGENFQRVVKLAVEELIEFIGYALWLIGTIEYCFQARVIMQQEPQTVVAKRRAARLPRSEGRY